MSKYLYLPPRVEEELTKTHGLSVSVTLACLERWGGKLPTECTSSLLMRLVPYFSYKTIMRTLEVLRDLGRIEYEMSGGSKNRMITFKVL